MAGVLPPWHNGCHGSPVWRGFLPIGRYRSPSGDRPSGSRQGVTPCTPHRAHRARGHSRESGLAAELPPLGDRPRGSPVWCSFLPVSRNRPPSGDRPSGSRQGVTPCTPYRAHRARGHSRESGLAAELPPLGDRPRGSRVWCSFLPVGRNRPPSGNRPSGLLHKQHDLKPFWAFAPRNYPAASKHPKQRHLSLPSATCGGAERR